MFIKNCYIFDESDSREKIADLHFNEKIIEYGQNLAGSKATDKNLKEIKLTSLSWDIIQQINNDPGNYIIDAEGIIGIPGGIDAHVHFDTPGYTQREDFTHGSMSAAAGGITTVIDMPCTSIPSVTCGKNFDIKMDSVKDMPVVDYAFFGGINVNKFDRYETSMEELAAKGVRGFKTYFVSGMESYPRVNKYQFMKIIEKAKKLGLPVLLHAEDYELLSGLESELKSSKDDYLRYCRMRPALGEILAVSDAVRIAEAAEGNLHIVHAASAQAAEILNGVRNKQKITYETCPHYLYFTEKDFKAKGSSLKTAPVVKSEIDREKLWEYIKSGDCSFTASDHAPSTKAEKNTGSFMKDYGGIPGTQTLLPVIISEGMNKRGLSLSRLIDITSKNPARRYGLYPGKGSIQKGSDADITLFSRNKEWKFDLSMLLSKGETSPFEGETFTGKVVMTILRGRIIFHESAGVTVNKGYGKYLN